MKLSYFLLAITGSSVPTSLAGRVLNAFGEESYGVDVSFPVHYLNIQKKEDNPLGDRQKFYDDFLAGCRDAYGGKPGEGDSGACEITEEDRLDMSLRQPISMQVSVLTLSSHRHYFFASSRCSYCSTSLSAPILFRTTPILASRRCKHPNTSSTCSLIIGRKTTTGEKRRSGQKEIHM